MSQASGIVCASGGYPCKCFASNLRSYSVGNTHFGLPVAASSAASEPAEETKYTRPPATAGDDAIGIFDLKFHFSWPFSCAIA